MSFTSKQETSTAVASDLELEVQRERLFSDVRDAQERLRVLSDTEVELNSVVEDKESVAKEVLEQKTELETLKKQILKEGSKADNQNKKSDLKATKLAADLFAAHCELEDLKLESLEEKKKIEECKTAFLSLKEEVVRAINDSVSEEFKLDAKISQKKFELQNIDADIAEKKTEFNKNSEELDTQISAAEETLRALKEEAGEQTDVNKKREEDAVQELKRLEKGISTEQKKLDELRAETKSIEDAFLKREDDMAKREGTVSTKESWLLEKEETLRNTKSELEKHFNRTINNVII